MFEIILAALLCCSQLAIGPLTYWGGAPLTWLLLLALHTAAVIVNYRVSRKLRHHILLSLLLVITTPFAHDIFTLLYTRSLSGDFMSFFIGWLGAWAGTILVLLASIISIIIWIYKRRRIVPE